VSAAARDFVYLVAAVLFVLGLRGLTHPRTAVRGNLLGALGMLLACVVTLASAGLDFGWIIAGVLMGAVAGGWLARATPMTGMPQMVALLNGFGGAASFLVAGVELGTRLQPAAGLMELIAASATGLIGSVTLSGSLIAFAKLQEYRWTDRVKIPSQVAFNGVLLLVCLCLALLQVQQPAVQVWYWLLVALSLVLGVSLVISIGGADMPVVIALLNSYSGLAAAATGFVLSNTALIISGALVGASGIILTKVMCDGMNRSLANVFFGNFGSQAAAGPRADEVYATVKSTSPDEVAILLDSASRVVIVPGYGMAVSQAQHVVSDLVRVLADKQVSVVFGIHPVAGRMPGHMNVLLAEADIPYEAMKDMDEINAAMDQADVAIVLGANDVVNPVARSDPQSPIAGMPIIDVDKARTVIVIKRSLSPGFANIPNPLFAAPNALMLYGDGRKAVQEIINALKG
jgi:NAD(P) transhydrogenase subunit beta